MGWSSFVQKLMRIGQAEPLPPKSVYGPNARRDMEAKAKRDADDREVEWNKGTPLGM